MLKDHKKKKKNVKNLLGFRPLQSLFQTLKNTSICEGKHCHKFCEKKIDDLWLLL